MDISTIILKKLKGNLSIKEEVLFNEWLNASKENKEMYSRLKTVMDKEKVLMEFSDVDPSKAWAEVQTKTQLRKKQSLFSNGKDYLKYAAAILLLLGFGYGYWTSKNSSESIPVDQNEITLQLGNGEVKVLTTGRFTDIKDTDGTIVGSHKGNQLDYTQSAVHEELVYNTLTVPYGKRFDIVLSDGSKAHLNAGSSLKYPVKFLEHGERRVFLEGEAFFDVTEDQNHPFIVSADNMNVKVLGTEFNITSYQEDSHVNTVLVEGSVSLYGNNENLEENNTMKLEPGYRASWEKTEEKFEVKKVNTAIYTGWLNGKLVLKRMPFKDIMKKFQRYYNVSISNNYKALDDKVFTATFDVESIEEALDVFAEDTFFEYRLEGSHITINKPNQTNP